jgi:3-keto-5-aminohexanoate cleavage enzyme
MRKLIINAAITGMVPMPADNASLPVAPDQIVAEAVRCHNAGAAIIHVHARDASARPTWQPDIYRAIIHGIRAACPGLLISGSTSGRLWPEFDKRAAVLECQPDFGSLTPGSLNFAKSASVNEPEMIVRLATAMQQRGIMPELEFFDLGMIDFVRDHLIPRGIVSTPCYANILLGSRGTAAASPRNLVTLVEALPPQTTWSVAGIGRHQFPMNALAVTMGGHVRVGLEDNLWMDPDRRDPATNARLIERVVRLAQAAGRDPASPAEAREIIGLPGA